MTESNRETYGFMGLLCISTDDLQDRAQLRNKTALLNEPASVLTHCVLGQIISALSSSVCRFPTSYT